MDNISRANSYLLSMPCIYYNTDHIISYTDILKLPGACPSPASRLERVRCRVCQTIQTSPSSPVKWTVLNGALQLTVAELQEQKTGPYEATTKVRTLQHPAHFPLFGSFLLSPKEYNLLRMPRVVQSSHGVTPTALILGGKDRVFRICGKR